MTGITIGWTSNVGNNHSNTDAFTIGINTGAILAVAAFIYSLLTGQPMESPALQYA